MSGTRLLLITDAVGGVWVYSLELARALAPLGVEAIVTVMGPSPSARQREEAAGIRLIDTGLPLEWLDTSRAEIRRAGEALKRIADIEQADIVQTCSAALLADADFGQPCVAVQHSCLASWWAAVKRAPLPTEFRWRRDMVERGLRRASTIVAPSLAFAAETARCYDVPAPVSAVHNGRRGATFAHIPQGQFVFTASRLWDEGKNVATLDAAAARLAIPFQAAGAVRGPNGAAISLQHLQSLGELSPTRIAGLLAARPIFASAALYEPFGLAVLEAASAGCALVLSDIPTHRELWHDAAVFVGAHGEAAFVEIIQMLVEDNEARQALGRAAKARAQLFTPERMALGMADIYARLAQRASVSGPRRMAGAA
jgi:glycosyltransferase involved in cell wall biosynthesis